MSDAQLMAFIVRYSGYSESVISAAINAMVSAKPSACHSTALGFIWAEMTATNTSSSLEHYVRLSSAVKRTTAL